MHANLKGGNALVRFLLSHGEKIGMLGILVCSGMIIWSALGVDRLSVQQTPNDLTQKLKAADQKVKASTYQNYPEDEKVISKPLNKEEAVIKPIAKSDFPNSRYAFNRPILDPVSLRTDPLLLAPEDLEANGDYGLWASAPPGIIRQKQLAEQARLEKEERQQEERERASGNERDAGQRRNPDPRASDARDLGRRRKVQKGPIVVRAGKGAQLQGFEDIKARSWVTVLARIPVEQQYLQYDDALQLARGYDPARDIPVYGAYLVERAEITDSGQTAWKSLPIVKAKTITDEIKTYPIIVPDVIDPRVQHPILTHPLPPLILREWDERVSHSSMPLASEIDPSKASDEVEAAEVVEEGSEEFDIFGEPLAAGASGRRDRPGAAARGNARTPGAPRGILRRGGGGGRGEAGGRDGGRSGGGYLGAGSGTTLDTTYTWDRETSHLLLRFFDHTVEAGHRYRYRIRLILKDVNKGIEEKYLDQSVSKRLSAGGKSYRLTDWSKPSGIASVPLPARVYLMSAKPAKDANFTDEPELELLVKSLDSQFAAEIALSKEFIRGSVINLHDSVKVIWSNDFDPEEDTDKFSMRTGITLLDFQGGEKLSRKNRDLLSPARALLMDPAGKLFVQSELDDEEGVAEYQSALEQDPKDRRGGGFNPGEFGRGGRGR